MKFRQSASLAVIAAALALSACGGDEDTGPNSDPAARGAPQSAGEALAALGLAEPGRATWTDRVEDGGAYTFTDFTLTTEEGALTAARLVLEDPRMSEQGPVFERLAMSDGEMTYEDGRAGFAAFTISDAGPGVGRALANMIRGEGGFDDIPLEQQTFSSLTLDTLRLNTEGGDERGPGELVIARAEAGAFDGETLDSFTLTDLAFDAEESGDSDESGGAVALTLAGIDAQGVNVDLLRSGMAGDMAASPFTVGASAGLDQYERIAVTGLRAVSGGMSVTMPDFIAEITERRGGTLVSTAAMPALTLAPTPGSADAAAFADALQQLGYESMAFSFASETTHDPDDDRVTTTGENYLAMEDGFRMAFEQDVSGVEAYTAAYQAWLAAGGEVGSTPPAEVLAPLMIRSATIRLEDRSLLDRAITLMAERQGTTPAQLRAQSGMFVAMGAAMAGGSLPRPMLAELSGALTRFIGEGGTLVMAFEPEAPVSAARFMEEGGPDLTGLTVRHEAAE